MPIWRSSINLAAKSCRTSRWRMQAILDQAIAAAADAAAPMRRLAAWQRKAVLKHLLARCRRAPRRAGRRAGRRGRQADSIRAGRSRAADRHDRDCGARNRRASMGEVLPLDMTRAQRPAIAACGSACRSGRAAFITPWNFPLNLVAHKIAPAHRLRLPVRAQAGELHADQRADPGRDSGRDRFARRARFRFCR